MMKRWRCGGRVCVLAVLLLSLDRSLAQGEIPHTNAAPVEAAFDADCEALVIREIGRAEKELLVAVYEITRPTIVSALADSARRRVRVRLKYDAKQADYEGMKDALKYLEKQGVRCEGVRMAKDYGSMHHKFVVIDRQEVLTGSFNFTSPASEANFKSRAD